MKVTISIGGKFQLFDLAKQLLKRGYLQQLITSYPKFEVVKYGIPRNKVSSVIIKEILERGWRKLPRFLRNVYNPQYFIHETFDILSSLYFKGGADIVIAGPRISKKAKKYGAITITEWGSSHPNYQYQVLKEEYEKFGVKIEPFQLAHPKVTERNLVAFQEADYISVPSSFNKRTFMENGIPANKIIQVPYGVDLSLFKQVPKLDKIFRVIFGGGLCLRKGTHYLLQAFAELNLPNSELLLIGAINPEIVPFLKKYEGSYKHMTYRSLKELHKYYSQGSVFVLPSLEEGLAMVQPQAMACGLPVICTTNTGGEDIVRDGVDGFVIPIRDVEKLKEKILYLHKNPEICRQMGQSAKERVSTGFTWDDYGDKMIANYERILKERK